VCPRFKNARREPRRPSENPRVRLAAQDIIPARNALKHGENVLPPRALRLQQPRGRARRHRRSYARLVHRAHKLLHVRQKRPPEAGYSACSRSGKASSTRMSIPNCSSVIRAESGADAAAAGDGGIAAASAAAAARAGRAAGGGDERKRGRRVPRLRRRFAFVSRNCASLGVVFDHQGSAVGRGGRQRAGPLRDRRRGPCRRPPQHVTLERRPSHGQWAMRVVAARTAAVPLSGDAGMRCGRAVRVAMGLAWPIVPHLPPALLRLLPIAARTSRPLRREQRLGGPRACAREGVTARRIAYPQARTYRLHATVCTGKAPSSADCAGQSTTCRVGRE
jgi:hypothetical protein